MVFERKFLVFIGGGLVSAVVDVTSMQMLIFSGIHAFISVTIGFLLGLFVNFIFHAKITFKAPTTKFIITKYIIIVGVNYIVTLGFVSVSLSLLESALPGKIASLPVIAFDGFLLSKYWIFR